MLTKLAGAGAEKVRWKVVFDGGEWILGFYRPEFKSLHEIRELEKHDAPEAFLLLEGDVILVVEEDGAVREIALKEAEVVITDNWHNAYSPSGEGLALVVEKKGIKTEFKGVKL